MTRFVIPASALVLCVSACGGTNGLCQPTLFIIDAGSHSVSSSLFTGNNAHSVAVDGATHRAFFPLEDGGAGKPVLRILRP